ncbi:MAG: DegV family protein [Anaerolineales bacterium]|nr:DegV family protein [Anaerolineales bacterium]
MSKISIVTDSSVYLPPELVEKYDIQVVPLVLVWGEQTLEDGVDIQPAEFYTRLKESKVMPSTSQATPGSFQRVFSEQLGQGRQVLAILLSPSLSGTVASAMQARGMFADGVIEIVESNSVAMALGFQVLAAARAAADGANLDECIAVAKKALQHTGVVFAVDTLEFLHRGGRIGGGSRFLGAALNIKPILEVAGGHVEAVERVRTRNKSICRVVELVEERIAGRRPLHLAVLHANAPDEANELLAKTREHFDADELFLTEVSPVIGTHAGPGTIGLAFMAGM